MTLIDFTRKYGATKLAQELNVTKDIVYQWCRGKAFPRPEKLYQINDLSDGKVSYKIMVNHYLNSKYRHK